MKHLLNRFLTGSGSAYQLAFFRISFGAILFWEACRYFYPGTIHQFFIEPRYFFHYFNWDFIKPLPGNGMYFVFGALAIAALGVTLGWFYRLSASLLFLLFTYVFLLDQTHYLNHAYLLCLISFIMIFLPAAKILSVDVLRNPALKKQQIPKAAISLLQFQVAIVYIFGGIAKINLDWLQGEPMRMWLNARKHYPVVGEWLGTEFSVYFFSYGGLLFDLLIVPFLLFKKTRLPAFAIAAAFHLTNVFLFNIGVFPWMMIAATLILFVPEFCALIERKFTQAYSLKISQNDIRPLRKSIQLALFTWCLLQVLIPLRHFLFPGNVSWTEEGHKFSWHMKLRSKKSKTRFFVEDKTSGNIKEISPAYFLTQKQIGKMGGNPEMLNQFCRFLKEQLAAQGITNVMIKTEAYASLNGRKFQLLIEPQTGLSSKKYTILPAAWILPLTVSLQERQDFSDTGISD